MYYSHFRNIYIFFRKKHFHYNQHERALFLMDFFLDICFLKYSYSNLPNLFSIILSQLSFRFK